MDIISNELSTDLGMERALAYHQTLNIYIESQSSDATDISVGQIQMFTRRPPEIFGRDAISMFLLVKAVRVLIC